MPRLVVLFFTEPVLVQVWLRDGFQVSLIFRTLMGHLTFPLLFLELILGGGAVEATTLLPTNCILISLESLTRCTLVSSRP